MIIRLQVWQNKVITTRLKDYSGPSSRKTRTIFKWDKLKNIEKWEKVDKWDEMDKWDELNKLDKMDRWESG